jgi:hypothetical protein
MMQAIAISEPGGPEVLVPKQIPTPEAGAGDVLIKVAAAGINRPDVMQRIGLYPPPPGACRLQPGSARRLRMVDTFWQCLLAMPSGDTGRQGRTASQATAAAMPSAVTRPRAAISSSVST